MCSFKRIVFLLSLIIIVTFQTTIQYCPTEVSTSGISVTWYESQEANFIRSDPLCVNNKVVLTRNCTKNGWTPSLNDVGPCQTPEEYLDTSSCPPGFNTIENSKRYCYQIEDPSPWRHPCSQSGGGTVIAELNENEIESMLNYLNTTNYKHLWLPAQRRNILNPIVWSTPGPNWGQIIKNNSVLPLRTLFFKNCLLLDVQERMLLTESCSNEYPSLCFYVNGFYYPTQCPDNYQAFPYMPEENKCFGIEKTETELTFHEFLNSKCKNPMGNGEYKDLRRYTYTKIAELNLTKDTWCWFGEPINNSYDLNSNSERVQLTHFVNAINNNGSLGLIDSFSTLPCMACETNIISVETEMLFEFDEEMGQLYLTIYFPSGLWKYNSSDKGVRCFSDAEGFSTLIDVNDLPITDFRYMNSSKVLESFDIDRVIYTVNLVTDRSASYWCEGHTKHFSLIISKKIVVNPQGDEVHVFSLVLKLDVHRKSQKNDASFSELTENINSIFKVNKVLIMDILEYNSENMLILIHLHVAVNNTYNDLARNLQTTLDILKIKASVEFPKFFYSLVNISSSVYCLPTTSNDSIILDWELTSIGYITSPKQLCLQGNGLPVNRQCLGSYLLGSAWGKIDGQCDINYKPSATTTFLFNFTRDNTVQEYAYSFLTLGLGFIFKKIDTLIPADIYYLSLSLQYVSHIAQQNISSVEIGDMNNIAWAINKMMSVDNSNLRLAQTLNSTNAILEYTNNIIELIATNNDTLCRNMTFECMYQLAVQPQFIVQVSYPKESNITGLVVIRNGISHRFTDMIIRPLYRNTTIKEVLLIENLEVASWIPDYVVDSLRKNSNKSDDKVSATNDFYVITKVYNDNSVFQEFSKSRHIVNSLIVEVTIPGYSTNLENPIPLIFRDINENELPKACGYWDFQSESSKIFGTWSSRGCVLQSAIKNFTVCECYHLTHFTQLLNITGEQNSCTSTLDVKHEKALNLITLTGSFLSLVGIVGIWITATVFDSWRKKTGTKVLIQLSISIALPLILIIVFNLDNSIIVENEGLHLVPRTMIIICVGLGAMFQYSILANFMWMLITAILQFIRYVRVLGVSRPSRFMMKLMIIGWGIPFIPVLIVLLIDYENYVPNPSSRRSFCYPSGLNMILGIILPVCIILLINIILFILVIKSISKSTDMRATDRNLVSAQFRLSIFLFFLLGLTWLFGVASFSGKLIWSYLFCVTSSVQGFVLFIYFVICDPNTRNMWIAIIKPQFKRSRVSVTTISSG